MSATTDRWTQLPRPAPDRAFFNATLEAGFRAYPEREANYARYKAAERGERADYLPIRLDVENVSRCNYHCTMCQVSDWPGLKRAEDMPFDDFQALLNQQVGVIEIKLQGMGEPFLGGSYIDMIAYARSRHIWVRSTTNGSLLHLKDNYRRVIDADICELQVSIDGATKPTYEAIRRGGTFERVMDNCRIMNRYAREAGRHRTRMWVVLQRANLHEAELLPALAAELGFSRLTISLDLNDWGQDRWRAMNDQVDVHREFTPQMAAELVTAGAARGVEVTFWFIDEKYDVTEPAKLCQWPFERVYVSSDMRIVPCCMMATPDVMDLGDARQLTQEWNGARMTAFRKLHLTGRIPKPCRSCYKHGGATDTAAAAQAQPASSAL